MKALYFAAAFLVGMAIPVAAKHFIPKPVLPVCEKYQVLAAQDDRGNPVVVIDMANIVKLAQLIRGLSDGTCRLAAPQAPSTSV